MVLSLWSGGDGIWVETLMMTRWTCENVSTCKEEPQHRNWKTKWHGPGEHGAAWKKENGEHGAAWRKENSKRLDPKSYHGLKDHANSLELYNRSDGKALESLKVSSGRIPPMSDRRPPGTGWGIDYRGCEWEQRLLIRKQWFPSTK